MKLLPWLLLTLALGAASGTLSAATPDEINGTWSPDGGRQSKIEISPCPGAGKAYCGAIVWLARPRTDDKNEAPGQRKRPLDGIRLIENFKFEGGSTWVGGKFYSPDLGKTFPGAKFVLLNKNELEIQEPGPEHHKIAVWHRVVQ